MPTYSYACRDCDRSFDIQQSFTDDALTVCRHCGGTLRKVFGAVGVTFNGSGFYRTDSRGAAKTGGTAASEGASSGAGASSSGSSASGSPSPSDSSSSSASPSPGPAA